MTEKQFNEKWSRDAYSKLMECKENWREEYAKYLEDCYSMYEETGFAPTFKSPYSGEVEVFEGMKFKVLRRATTEDGFDLETLPAWEVEFENGKKFMCLPEEICTIERKA